MDPFDVIRASVRRRMTKWWWNLCLTSLPYRGWWATMTKCLNAWAFIPWTSPT